MSVKSLCLSIIPVLVAASFPAITTAAEQNDRCPVANHQLQFVWVRGTPSGNIPARTFKGLEKGKAIFVRLVVDGYLPGDSTVPVTGQHALDGAVEMKQGTGVIGSCNGRSVARSAGTSHVVAVECTGFSTGTETEISVQPMVTLTGNIESQNARVDVCY